MAARTAVAHQAFAIGGLITFEKGQNRAKYGSADNAPLVKAALVLVTGNSLFETLMLNMHQYNAVDGEPFSFIAGEDRLAWEVEEEVRAEKRALKGYLDLLTWQSRRLRLHPEQDEQERTVVRQVVSMKGNELPDRYDLHDKETMVAFTKRLRASPGQEPWPALTFREDRVLWRDSLTLLQSAENQRQRPKTVTWLHDLVADGAIPASSTYSLSVFGLATSRASVLLWRHERLPLPLRYVSDERLVATLQRTLAVVEEVAQILWRSSRYLASLMLFPDVETPNDLRTLSRQRQEELGELMTHLGIEAPYWAQLGVVFPRLIADLAEDTDGIGATLRYGSETIPWWAENVRRSALAAFQNALEGLDRSARMLRATARSDMYFRQSLKPALDRALEPYRKTKEGVTRQ
jgi:CRISPR system Cascade subunit CasA